MTKKKKECVYIISTMKAGLIKIGVSVNPEKRMKSLQCSCGQKLFVWHHSIPIDCAYELESMLHRYFAEYRTYGEWFTVGKKTATIQMIRFIKKLKKDGKII